MKNRKRIRKYFDGGSFTSSDNFAANLQTLTNTANQALLSISAQERAKKEAEAKRREQEKNALNIAKQDDTVLLGEQELDGRVGVEYYNKLGGGINAGSSYSSTGGKLKRLSSDMEKVEGNTHAQGGVKLKKKGGAMAPFAEVEDEETIKDGNKVYSEFLISSNGVSYAENAEQLSKEKGKLEKNLNKGDAIANNTVKRRIGIIDSKEDKLYQEQEASKAAETTKEFATGGSLDSYMPYVDNLVNGILTLTTPKLQKPVTTKARELKTDVNVSGEMNDVNRAVDSTTKFIENNTSNSAAARNAISKTRLQGAAQKAKIRGFKENRETQLQNANAANKQNVATRNNAILNRFGEQQTARRGAIQSRISQNFSNLSGDYIDKRNFDNATDYNNKRLAITKSMFNNGLTERTDDKVLKNLLDIMSK